MKSMTLRIALVAGLALSAAACGIETTEDASSDESLGEVSSAQVKGGTSTPTGACTVISGANKGKKGTFNADGDCEGDWGLSECKNQDGTDSGKCKAGHVIVVTHPIWRGGTSSGAVYAP